MAQKQAPIKNPQQKKRNRQNAKINEANRKKKSTLRTAIKKARVVSNQEDISKAYKLLDSSASKGLITQNRASKLKSRLKVQANNKK